MKFANIFNIFLNNFFKSDIRNTWKIDQSNDKKTFIKEFHNSMHIFWNSLSYNQLTDCLVHKVLDLATSRGQVPKKKQRGQCVTMFKSLCLPQYLKKCKRRLYWETYKNKVEKKFEMKVPWNISFNSKLLVFIFLTNTDVEKSENVPVYFQKKIGMLR